jgi:hypothetical protein
MCESSFTHQKFAKRWKKMIEKDEKSAKRCKDEIFGILININFYFKSEVKYDTFQKSK